MFYLITGENTPLIEDERSKICSKFQGIPFEKLSENASLDDFVSTTETCDMFTPQKGQIIINPIWLKKISKETVESFERCLLTAFHFKLPLLFIIKKIDKRSIGYKLLKKHKVIEKDCPLFKEWENQKVIDWITYYCQKENSSIDIKAAQMLMDAYGSNLGIIKQEIDKCMVTILPKQNMTSDDLIHASSNSVGEYARLSNSIKKGNINNIIFHMNQLMNHKEDPHKIFNQFLFQINQLLPLALAQQQQIHPDKLAARLGKHPFFIKKQMESLIKNPIKNKLPQILIALSEIDQLIKSGKLPSKLALIRFANQLKYQL
jgi:DNA polymerase III delta subunit